MAAIPTASYEFTFPICNKKITWSPLRSGQELQIQATYRDLANRHLQNYARLAARVASVDAKPVTWGPNDFADFEEMDVEAFAEHVNVEEAKRQAAFAKKSGANPIADLDAAIERAKAAIAEVGAALGAVRAQAALAASAGPLAMTATTQP